MTRKVLFIEQDLRPDLMAQYDLQPVSAEDLVADVIRRGLEGKVALPSEPKGEAGIFPKEWVENPEEFPDILRKGWTESNGGKKDGKDGGKDGKEDTGGKEGIKDGKDGKEGSDGKEDNETGKEASDPDDLGRINTYIRYGGFEEIEAFLKPLM